MKRSSLSRISAKQRRRIKESQPVRDQLRKDHPLCMLCKGPATDIHEIARGQYRTSVLDVRSCLLHLCHGCHLYEVQAWPVEWQLALKGLADPEHYDRVEFNTKRGRAEDAVSEREVFLAMPKVIRKVLGLR